jgi:hypothetical protein
MVLKNQIIALLITFITLGSLLFVLEEPLVQDF